MAKLFVLNLGSIKSVVRWLKTTKYEGKNILESCSIAPFAFPDVIEQWNESLDS